ncbi:DEAD/DEAH box helicase [Flavobacteriaceae bacterium]|nr:DEAD/DEAH box helicase [Flavobacteriaceae bacterium]MDB4235384.1 DEAD/DEAH box helicase [bacterium]MDC1391926.1 DEAD/DEAH box helicase [Flavobacteriaceae bacterium]
MIFEDLKLEDPILKAIEKQGYTNPTPIQEQAIPILLNGHDLLGVAQTGTGKTAAFGIPILNHLLKENNTGGKRKIKALVVTPTRELAIQIAESFTAYSQFTNLRNTVIFGGVKQSKQVASLQQGVDILVATPGRLLDLMNQGYISFSDLKYVVLDEADQMLDMGFIHDVKKIIAKLPLKRQSLFFSATMPKSIVDLSQKMLGNFKRITIKPQQATAEKVEQGVYFVSKNNKPKLLIHLIEGRSTDSVLVFSRTKHGANKIVKVLDKANIKSAAIHGNKSQLQRQKALGAFKDGSLKVLIATDIAARGIDVDDLALVINYDLPNVSETYVHRIGRTGRASASGIALSFCMGDERPYLKDIENLIKQQVPRMGEHPFMEGADVVEGSLSKKPQARNKNHNKSINTRNKNRNWR